MTATALHSYIGKKGFYHFHGLQVLVFVKDAKFEYGRVHLLITPYGGSGIGETWVGLGSMALDKT